MSESGGLAVAPQLNLVYPKSGVLYRRLAYRASSGTGTTLTQGTEVNIGGSYSGAPSRVFVVGSRFDGAGSNWTRGRYLIRATGAATSGYFWNASSTGQSSTAAALTWHSTTTNTYYGSAMCGISSESFNYHEWYRDTSGDLNVRINLTTKDFTTAYSETANITLSSAPTYIDSLKDCINGLGTIANSRGVSFMFNVNTSTGKDELVICNGYVIQRIQDIFGYTGISSSSNIDSIHSVTVNKSTCQGAISFWNDSTKKLDVAFFTVTCPNTTTITVTWGSLFTHTLTENTKPRLGKGTNAGRFNISSVSTSANTLNVITVDSSGVNNMVVSNTAALTGYANTITEHTCMTRFADGAGGNNTLFAAIYSGTSLFARAINRG
jgi:hypothetical protein